MYSFVIFIWLSVSAISVIYMYEIPLLQTIENVLEVKFNVKLVCPIDLEKTCVPRKC